MNVHIVGTGLLGTSLGLSLSRHGYRVTLEDLSPTAVQLAADMGAGEADHPKDPDVVVIATPPDVVAHVIVDALRTWPNATITDVASVKTAILDAVKQHTRDRELDRYIGSHPMAGREKSGAIAARADLFMGRPWVVCSDEDTPQERLEQVVTIARAVGASVMHLDPLFHDSSVARVSHAPQVVASIMAAQLIDMPSEGVALAGQGLRDTTRIADSDPGLWTQILAGNAAEVAAVLRDIRSDLDRVIDALDVRPGSLRTIAGSIAAGNDGRARIPGKHGMAPATYETVTVYVDDAPGTLSRLFADIGGLGVNIEDIRIDHATGVKLGSVELSVVPAHVHVLVQGLSENGWRLPEQALDPKEEK